MAKNKTKQELEAELAESKAATADAQAKAAEAEAKTAAANQSGDGDAATDRPAPVAAQTLPEGAVQFCSRFKQYGCRAVRFENYRVVVEDEDTIKQLKNDPKFGNEFWVCSKNG